MRSIADPSIQHRLTYSGGTQCGKIRRDWKTQHHRVTRVAVAIDCFKALTARMLFTRPLITPNSWSIHPEETLNGKLVCVGRDDVESPTFFHSNATSVPNGHISLRRHGARAIGDESELIHNV